MPEGPDRIPQVLGTPNEGPEAPEKRRGAALEASRRADADELSHQETKVQRAGLQERPLENVLVTAQVHTPHAARPIEMREGPFEPLAALPQQALAAHAANPPAVAKRMIRVTRIGVRRLFGVYRFLYVAAVEEE